MGNSKVATVADMEVVAGKVRSIIGTVIDDTFNEFIEKVRTGQFGSSNQSRSGDLLAHLNSSTNFKQIVQDVMVALDMPANNWNLMATYIGYMVFAGYHIYETELLEGITSKKLN